MQTAVQNRSLHGFVNVACLGLMQSDFGLCLDAAAFVKLLLTYACSCHHCNVPTQDASTWRCKPYLVFPVIEPAASSKTRMC